MEELAVEEDDKGLQKILKIYRKHPNPHIAKKIAAMLHRNAHAEVDVYKRQGSLSCHQAGLA